MNNLAATPGATPGGPRRLVLLRHAETAENAAGRFLGRSDPELDEHGVEQARRLASGLEGSPARLVVASPARRALQSAQLLGLREPVVEPDFREIDFGTWEGLTQPEVAERDPVNFAAFEHGEIDGFPGGETVTAVAERTVAALDRHRADSVLVVTHATVVRILVTALLGLPVSQYRARLGRPGHLSWTELEQHEQGWRLLSYDSRVVADRTSAADHS